MKSKSKWTLVIVVLLLVLVVMRQIAVRDSTPVSSVDPDGTASEYAGGSPEETVHAVPASGLGGNIPTVQGPDLQILQLQALLDDDSNRKKALAMALAMTKGTVSQQLSAIEAFRWLGGREAIKSLIELRNTAYPEVAEEAGRVLGHLLASGLYAGNLSEAATVRDSDLEKEQEVADGTEESSGTQEEESADNSEVVVFDAELWEKAIREAPSELDRDELMILMSAYPGTKSVPVLLNLLESGMSELRDHALEYLEFVTYGEKITTRKQGEDWLAVHGAMEDYTP